jgi:hypothetical protein
MTKINKYLNLLLNIEHIMSLFITKQYVSCVLSINLDYTQEKNCQNNTKSVFSKD